MKRYDLNLLTALDALLDERSVSRAAARLGVGQPAMSAALSRLRAMFGDPILVRGGGGMEPTPRARSLAGPLQETLAGIAALIDPGTRFDPAVAKRTLRMSGGDYAGMTVLPGLAGRIARAAPGIDVRFRYLEKDAALAALDDGRLDLAMLVKDDLPARFDSDVLIEETFVGAARRGHPVLARDVDLPSFLRYDHLLVTERADETGCIDVVLAERGHSRRIALTVPSAALAGDVLGATDLVAAIPSRAAARLASDGKIATFRLPVESPGWSMRVVGATRNAQDPMLVWVRQELRAAVADLGGSA